MSRLLTLLAASDPGFVPSNYMPAVKVEVAFNAGYTTPDADRVWTDVSEWVELHQGIADTFGRQDELSTADANRLTLTLDNSDGRFTAGRAASPYYPNVKLGRPIRLSLMTVTGYTSVRFVGFVNQWPVEWDGTDAYAKATITAGSRLSRLGLGQKLRSMVEASILATDPTHYFTLGDQADSTHASESSGNNAAPLTVTGTGSALVFGNAIGPRTDGLTALTLAGGEYLAGTSDSASGTAQSVSCFMLRTGNPAATETIVATFSSAAPYPPGIGVRVTPGGVIEVVSRALLDAVPTVQLASAANVCDGVLHHIAVTRSGATWNLYVDGVLANTTSGGNSDAFTSWTPLVGDSTADTVPLTGTVAHAAFWSNLAVSAASVADQADIGLSGAEGETTDARATRILGWAGVASTEIDTQAGNETMTYQQTSGQSVVDALRDVESTEGGVLFDGRDGRVTFHNRSHRYTAPVAVTLDMEAQQVEADYAPKLDPSTLTNDVTVDNPTTGESARAVDTASADEYGTVTSSAKSVADSYDPLQQKASWLVASYAEPRPRVPSMTVDLLAQVGGTPSAEDILALTIGSRVAVVNQPAQADTADADYFVEGYSEAIGPESYSITFNLSPAHPSLSAFMIEDATRGELDSSYVLAL